MHKYQPSKTVVVLGVEITFPLDAKGSEIADELSGLLTEQGIADPNSKILDWRFCPSASSPSGPHYAA